MHRLAAKLNACFKQNCTHMYLWQNELRMIFVGAGRGGAIGSLVGVADPALDGHVAMWGFRRLRARRRFFVRRSCLALPTPPPWTPTHAYPHLNMILLPFVCWDRNKNRPAGWADTREYKWAFWTPAGGRCAQQLFVPSGEERSAWPVSLIICWADKLLLLLLR
jgi:hypothetical protein